MNFSEQASAFVDGERVSVPGRADGKLAGLRFAVKDLIDVAGTPTVGGNPDWGLTHPVPEHHAWVVQTLLDAGASVSGKTKTCEISLGILGFNQFFGTPLNPRAPQALPGGSSSGSASAVAAGDVDFALGTDTGGSVRVPSSFCGIYGLRPTHGRVPFAGVCVQAPSFDTVGWFARDAFTLGRVGEVLLQEELPQAGKPRLLLAEDALDSCDQAVANLVRQHAQRLGELFGGVASVALADGRMDRWLEGRLALQSYEQWQTFGDWVDLVNPRMAFNVARNLVSSSNITRQQYEAGMVIRQEVSQRADHLLGDGTVLCIPTTPYTAPDRDLPLSTYTALSKRLGPTTAFSGLTGVPQLSIPIGEIDGRPIGLSLIGARNSDSLLLALAKAAAAV